MIDTTGRRESTAHMARQFAYEHLPPRLQAVSRIFHDAAAELIGITEDGPELTVSLRKLLEGKDAAVRANV